ncbi:PQQ-binding-like beta-propeller repeat protein [Embleya sp. NPDC056575]|uniref:protein kinase domain-containing protein n=1 Tax=unclassified Embleya TaxID=2699296 RepID=UPI0036C48E7B
MVTRILAGRYDLVRLVGRGGMGEVWEGRDRVIDRRVAVKMLVHDVRDTSGSAQFLREARTAGGLNHPGVVTVYDAGQDPDAGTLFLVMEFLTGRDLAKVLVEDGLPSVATTVGWAMRAAAALAAAHDAGVVHRDLKPANLMLTEGGDVKVLDFGIARHVESTHRSSTVMGTLAYMPPERFDEQPGDARSDLYSLGCVLHELLTGHIPFDATGPVAMMNAHLRRTPQSPGSLRDGVPAELDDLVLALLAKDPAHRPASAAEVGDRLARIVASPAPMSGGSDAEGRDTQGGFRETPALRASAQTLTAPNARAARAAPGTDTPGSERDTPTGTDADLSPHDHANRRRFLWLAAAGAAAVSGVGITGALLRGNDDPTAKRARNPQTWRFRTGHIVFAGAAVANGVVYVAGDDNVYALDAATGAKKWSHATTRPVDRSPTVIDGVVYVCDDGTTVYALDAVGGAQRWTASTDGSLTSAVVAADDVVYVGDLGRVYAFRAATGSTKWSTLVISGVAMHPAAAGDLVYVSTGFDGYVVALDAGSGTRQWSSRVDRPLSSPLVANGVVYVAGDDGMVHAFDAAAGSKKWSVAAGRGQCTAPAVAGGLVYVGSADNNVYALDTISGAQRWSVTTDAPVETSLTVVDGVVYVGNRRGMFALDAATGAGRWSHPHGSGFLSPTVVGGVVYVGSSDRSVYALDAATGEGPD